MPKFFNYITYDVEEVTSESIFYFTKTKVGITIHAIANSDVLNQLSFDPVTREKKYWLVKDMEKLLKHEAVFFEGNDSNNKVLTQRVFSEKELEPLGFHFPNNSQCSLFGFFKIEALEPGVFTNTSNDHSCCFIIGILALIEFSLIFSQCILNFTQNSNWHLAEVNEPLFHMPLID